MNKQDYLDSFERIWAKYPRKVNKGTARKTWLKLVNGYEEEDLKDFEGVCWRSIDAQIRYRKKKETEGVWVENWKHFATWFNGECWDDVLEDQDKKTYTPTLRKCKCGQETIGPNISTCDICYCTDENGKLKEVLGKVLKDGQMVDVYPSMPPSILREYYKNHPEIDHVKLASLDQGRAIQLMHQMLSSVIKKPNT